jgi:hypothetical protein
MSLTSRPPEGSPTVHWDKRAYTHHHHHLDPPPGRSNGMPAECQWYAIGKYDNDNKHVWPTWVLGVLFRGVRLIHSNHVSENVSINEKTDTSEGKFVIKLILELLVLLVVVVVVGFGFWGVVWSGPPPTTHLPPPPRLVLLVTVGYAFITGLSRAASRVGKHRIKILDPFKWTRSLYIYSATYLSRCNTDRQWMPVTVYSEVTQTYHICCKD